MNIFKRLTQTGIAVSFLMLLFSCHTTKKVINKAISHKDSSTTVFVNHSNADSIKAVNIAVSSMGAHHIDFKTFNAKIKVEYEDSKGKKPTLTANVKIIKDSAIWISLTASILAAEVFRVYITPDSVILLNKMEKEVQYRSMDYLQEVTEIPFDFKTLQDLLVGNPIFTDSNIVSYKKIDDKILLSTVGNTFKNLLTLSADNFDLLHSKLDDVDVTRNRTADITYSDFENKTGKSFSTYREITVSEKNKLDIRLNFKQYEFNKELSISFNVPKNYKRT
jgi:hypothetical protein